MIIKVGFSWAKIERATVTEEGFLRDFLGYTVKGRGGLSRTESLYFPKARIFPAGLANLVVRSARERGYSVEVSHRSLAYTLDTNHDFSKLWPHQKAGILKALEKERGIIQHATGCLSGDTIIEINRARESFKIKLKDLVHRFNGGIAGGKRWRSDIGTTVRYRADDGYIRLGKLKAAYGSGIKTTYIVTTESGKSIRATKDHRFLTKFGWKPLSDIDVGQDVWVAAGSAKKAGIAHTKPQYLVIGGLHRHPHAGRRGAKRGNLASVPKHRLVMEAAINGVSYETFIGELRKKIDVPVAYKFLDPKVFAVHHLDENSRNNELSNLAVLTHTDHHKQHGVDGGWKKVTETTITEKITSIVEYGEEETFDLEMESDPHNFIANGFVVHNSGKGTTISYLCGILHGRILVVVTSVQLLKEMYDRIKKWTGEAPGRVGGGYKELTKRVIVCCVPSLPKLPKSLLESFSTIIGDECFPAGTMVGNIPIEQVRVGDLVKSWDESAGEFVERRVTRVYKNQPTALIKVHLASGKTVVCTPEHPFLTESGWRLAVDLCGRSVLSAKNADCSMLSMQSGTSSDHNNPQDPSGVLQEVPIGKAGREEETLNHPVRGLSNTSRDFGKTTHMGASDKPCVLLGRPQIGTSAQSAKSGSSETGKSQCNSVIGTNEAAQPDAETGDKSEALLDVAKDWTQAPCSGGKWEGSNNTAISYGDSSGVGSGGNHSDEGQEGRRATYALQARYCKQEHEVCHRSRWAGPQQPDNQRKGSEERGVSSWDRVDRIEILEQGSDGTFGGLCKEGVVYNLEVEGTHTYTANGFVVHNCHSSSSNSYWRPLMKCINAGIRLGFSGTPLNRADKRTLHIVGLFGEIIHKYTPEQAANDKVTAKATLRLVKCRIPPLLAERHAKDGNYVEWDKVALANNRVRNLKIGELLRSPSIPYPKILFVRTMHHQDVLKGQYGFSETEKVRYVNHKTPIDEIAKIKEGLEDGTVEILISGPIFRQGVDMKRIATVINAAGGKATVDVIQKVGRGARRLQDDGTEKEDFLMIDFDDQGCGCGGQDHRSCEWLERHSRLRRAAYEQFGYKPMDFQ